MPVTFFAAAQCLPAHQRERLRRHPRHDAVEVQRHDVITFQPRLVPGHAGPSSPATTSPAGPLPAIRQELPHGQGILERDPRHRVQARAATPPVRISPGDLDTPGSNLRRFRVPQRHPPQPARTVRRPRSSENTIKSCYVPTTIWARSQRPNRERAGMSETRPTYLRRDNQAGSGTGAIELVFD